MKNTWEGWGNEEEERKVRRKEGEGKIMGREKRLECCVIEHGC